MDVFEALQEELKAEEKSLDITMKKVDFSENDIMRLNNVINVKINENKAILEASLGKAARYACLK